MPTQWYAFGTRQSFALIAGKYEMDFKARDFFGGNAAFASCFALVAPVGENSPPDCFLPLALLAPSLFESLYQYIIKTDTAKAVSVLMARCKGFEPLTFWFVGI